jgi:hypothetical protein
LRVDITSPDESLTPLESYHVSVNVDCFTEGPMPGRAETDEGIVIGQGLAVHTKPVRFLTEGCVKLVYPHGHDHLVLMALENTTKKRTMLRTVPITQQDGSLLGFARDQVYADSTGFAVTPEDDYKMMMVYYRRLEDYSDHYGMADYLIYMTSGPCTVTMAGP